MLEEQRVVQVLHTMAQAVVVVQQQLVPMVLHLLVELEVQVQIPTIQLTSPLG
jgi:hypothetical protein